MPNITGMHAMTTLELMVTFSMTRISASMAITIVENVLNAIRAT